MKKVAVLIVSITLIYLLAHVPYLNILFPLWFQLLLILGIAGLLFKWSKKIKGISMIILWLLVTTLLIFKSSFYAEQLSITIYFLLCLFIIEYILLFPKHI